MDAIVRAYQGRGETFRMIFGGAPEPERERISQASIMDILREMNGRSARLLPVHLTSRRRCAPIDHATALLWPWSIRRARTW